MNRTEFEEYGMYLGVGAMDMQTAMRLEAEEDRITGEYLVNEIQNQTRHDFDKDFNWVMERRYKR